jgi:hypothetical protein
MINRFIQNFNKSSKTLPATCPFFRCLKAKNKPFAKWLTGGLTGINRLDIPEKIGILGV